MLFAQPSPPEPLGGAPVPERSDNGRSWVHGLIAVCVLYLFISSVSMLGGGLKTIARDPAGAAFLDWLFGFVRDPVTGLFTGVLVTSLVQSSSFTTSMTVGLVAGGDVSLSAAIPIVMGANIGTSVTNTLVSLANIRRRKEFRRSLAGAVVHDFFNILSVTLLLPLEAAFGIISRVTEWVSEVLGGTRVFSADPTDRIDILKRSFGQIAAAGKWLTLDVLGLPPTVAGSLLAALALVVLFASLWVLVRLLRSLLAGRLSGVFSRTLFRNPGVAFMVGILTTIAVQSSSVTTSLVVPLIGAGILKLRQVYPYTLGANVGTTMTAILAALGTGCAPAMACAFGHLLFNIYGIAVFWPLQFIPLSLAKGLAKLAMRRRWLAVVFLFCIYFGVPTLMIALTAWLGT